MSCISSTILLHKSPFLSSLPSWLHRKPHKHHVKMATQSQISSLGACMHSDGFIRSQLHFHVHKSIVNLLPFIIEVIQRLLFYSCFDHFLKSRETKRTGTVFLGVGTVSKYFPKSPIIHNGLAFFGVFIFKVLATSELFRKKCWSFKTIH